MIVDLEQFVKDATRTESVKEEVAVNKHLLENTLKMYIASGNILDQIKKHAFYGSDYNLEKYGKTIEEQLADIEQAVDLLNKSVYPWNQNEEKLDVNTRMFHSMVGVCTEATEIAEALVTQLETGELDDINVGEEYGDILYYIAIAHDSTNMDYKKCFDTVIEKLKIRFPDKFSQDLAEQRNLVEERELLEDSLK